MTRRNLLSQQHLVNLRCIDATSKKLLIVYLSQVKVTINNNGDTNTVWIAGTTLDSVGRLQPVKVLASQLFYNFDELVRPYGNFPAHLMGDVIEDIPKMDSINPPFGDSDLCIVSLPAVIPVSYEHGLTAGTLNSCQLEAMEDYHPIMDLWGDTMQYQFSLWSGMSALMLCTNSFLDNHGFESRASKAVGVVQLQEDDNNNEPFIQCIRHHLEMLKKHNIQSWLEDNPDWCAPQDKPQTLFIPLGAVSVPDSQAALAVTNSASPDGRVVQHRIWGSTLVTASDGSKQ
eukprot:8048625-Ditylum_brightwellii.AAC.1